MAVKAHRDGVRNAFVAAIRRGADVIGLDLHAAEAVTDAATPVASSQKSSDFVAVERHRASPQFPPAARRRWLVQQCPPAS
jgi:hypothetical protein